MLNFYAAVPMKMAKGEIFRQKEGKKRKWLVNYARKKKIMKIL